MEADAWPVGESERARCFAALVGALSVDDAGQEPSQAQRLLMLVLAPQVLPTSRESP